MSTRSRGSSPASCPLPVRSRGAEVDLAAMAALLRGVRGGTEPRRRVWARPRPAPPAPSTGGARTRPGPLLVGDDTARPAAPAPFLHGCCRLFTERMIPPRKLPGNSRRRLRMRKESAGRRLRPIPAALVSGDHSPTIRSKRFPAPFRSRSAPVTGGVPGPRCPAPPAPARVPHPRGTERNGISISDQGMPRESSGSPGSAPPAPEHPALPFPPPPPLRTGLHPVRPPRSDRTRPAGPPPGGPAGTRTRVLPGPPAPLLGAARRGRAARGGAHRFRTADAHRPRGSTGPPRAGRGGPVNRVGALEIADGVPPRLCAPAFPVLQP